MKQFNTRLIGLDVSRDSKNIGDNELAYSKNAIINRHGELVSRHGLRLINDGAGSVVNTDGFINGNTRFRYKQIVTPGGEVLDVFAEGNKVYIYDNTANNFQLIYEAPGKERVDIDVYLGYILVTSQSSNLEIIRKYQRAAYIFQKSANTIIRATGAITEQTAPGAAPGSINFIAEDTLSDSTVFDFDVDETKLIAATITGGVTVGSTRVDPSTPGATEVSSVVAGSDHKWWDDVIIHVGYKHRDSILVTATSGDFGQADVYLNSEFNSENIRLGTIAANAEPGAGSSVGNKLFVDANDGGYVIQTSSENTADYTDGVLSTSIEIKKTIKGKPVHLFEEGEDVIYSGCIKSGNDITSGVVKASGKDYPQTGGTFNTHTVSLSYKRVNRRGTGEVNLSYDGTTEWDGKQVYYIESITSTVTAWKSIFKSGTISATVTLTDVFAWSLTDDFSFDNFNTLFAELVFLQQDGTIVSGAELLVDELNNQGESSWFLRTAGQTTNKTVNDFFRGI
jgi:hypothetical protein